MSLQYSLGERCPLGNRQHRIAQLNDCLRKSAQGGRIVMTAGIAALSAPDIADVVAAIATFDAFNEDNDPHGEHDCAVLEVGSKSVIWKIDYYDRSMTYGSDDPADPAITTRVLTVMLAEEY